MSSDSSVSDYCRLCKISFKVKFGSSVGKQGYSSSENLFRPSKRKECFGVVLAEICKEVGLPLVQDSRQYSDRVCNPCGRKIRNLGQLYQLIRPAITSTESTPVKSSKRTLDTPDKASPAWRKSKTVRVNSPYFFLPLPLPPLLFLPSHLPSGLILLLSPIFLCHRIKDGGFIVAIRLTSFRPPKIRLHCRLLFRLSRVL